MVKAWREMVTIPTYEVGSPEKNPVFLEKRVYQGSSGAVYPYPVIESISDYKIDKEYAAIFIENEYIKVMILPELGGRVQMAYDKICRRHFIYYNHVIKPALVGLAGPWISGGIEFNWPQHHRPSTYMPINSTIEENRDGSVTVWVNEMERMTHQKGMAGFTLHPGHAYLEVKGVVYNRTEIPQTFLWWANPAVSVNDHYQSIFPPDINAVFDHGKRAVSSFPVATGTYYNMDYSAGVDISNYKNIRVPTSYMAVNSKYDFEGGYENDTKAGMLHVANHHVSPGKKQWTWGNGDFGKAWDRNLTDEDGPYIELMAGVYTENQPDFAWLQPYEEKSFVQYFMPFRELGIIKNASKDLLINVTPESDGCNARIKVFATSVQTVTVRLCTDNRRQILYERTVDISPEILLDDVVDISSTDFSHITLEIVSGNNIVLTWHAEPDDVKPIPDTAEAALLPAEIKTTEQLYLTGLHLEQYRHATYNPIDYYEEALRRDPFDVRNNNALGLWYLRKGRFSKAETHLRTAVKILMKRNPNPYDGEPLYNLGLALKYQGYIDEAYDMFYKATWNGAWQDAAYFSCAQISLMQGRLTDAADEIDRSLIRNWHNHKGRALKTTILRRIGRKTDALSLTDESLQIDRFNFGCMYEKYLLTADESVLERMRTIMNGNAHDYDETALDYCAAGCKTEAIGLWYIAIEARAITPMTYYYLGWCLSGVDIEGAKAAFAQAEEMDPYCCFPNRTEAIFALRCAMNIMDKCAKAHYYLGCLYYDKRQHDIAVREWMASVNMDGSFPTVWRNLALAAFNKQGDKEKAINFMERAFALDKTDARVLMELDQLYKRLQWPHAKRIAMLREYSELVVKRDDLLLELATLLNQTGAHDEALRIIDAHTFHPWEGGEGKVLAQYQAARVELAKQAISDGRHEEALRLLNECLIYPPNLGEGKLYGAQENDFYYLMGLCYEALGESDKANEYWQKATEGSIEPTAALYYNDAKPDKIFYQGLALIKLGFTNEANRRFYRLVNYGKKHLFETVRMDYFAVSLPDLLIWDDDLQIRNDIHCKYMMVLGYYGLGNQRKAEHYLKEISALDINHQGVQAFITLCNILR